MRLDGVILHEHRIYVITWKTQWHLDVNVGLWCTIPSLSTFTIEIYFTYSHVRFVWHTLAIILLLTTDFIKSILSFRDMQISRSPPTYSQCGRWLRSVRSVFLGLPANIYNLFNWRYFYVIPVCDWWILKFSRTREIFRPMRECVYQ